MRNLYENIEDMYLTTNDPGVLIEPVNDIQGSLQMMAEANQMIKSVLGMLGGHTAGQQYEHAVITVNALGQFLYEAADCLNNMQGQIVGYMNKMYVWEDLSGSASVPASHDVRKIDEDADTSQIHYLMTEMQDLANSIKRYAQQVTDAVDKTNAARSNIGSVWKDSQYNIFSDFIDEICKEANNAVSVVEEYGSYLSSKVRDTTT